ncbi:hypothetical protein AWM68_11995 [Fictibacillus phosphorivorans]|uniref:Uncharacterized protein n=1 Tax=Fictibacillus phosphorivorans TaxID=1221500 RepID=A0A168CPE0_9BACL|nr:hypothetical protein [Fictibacillus phosphorivorans]KZE63831.1 hypothetical protein AWM68_11995 [Fictibacillus phosphorivorans]
MEVMTYVLWVLLLMGSVMKNYMVAVSMPKTGQVMMTNALAVSSFSYAKVSDKIESDFERANAGTFNKQNFSWVDTS